MSETSGARAGLASTRNRWQAACGVGSPDTGLFFVTYTGRPWHPEQITRRFERLVASSGLPLVRLHDHRHCARYLPARQAAT
jgi:hypothetical protein